MSQINALKKLFYLDKDITYLNFGAFGATPIDVMKRYQSYQIELEHNPVQFITQKGLEYLSASRQALADYIHCDSDDIVMMTNPSYAVNTIAKSIKLMPGDEILTTNLEYGACDKTWNFVCNEKGAKYIRQHISLPLTDSSSFVNDLFSGVSDKTKLIFISHITSSTALIFPVEAVIKKAKTLNIPVFIDGAHAPGHIHLDLKALDVDYYTGACHKWMMTPKGSSFMYVSKSLQETVYPLVVSWGYEALVPSHSIYLDWHQMNGTRDYSALLCVPESIKFMERHDWALVSTASRKMVKDNAEAFAASLNSSLLAPLDDEFIGQMLSVEIQTPDPDRLYQTFVHQYHIEIPVMRQADKVYLRYSINGFNNQQDLDRLFYVIKKLKGEGLIL